MSNKKSKWVVSIVLIKDDKQGTMAVCNDLMPFNASNKEEATGMGVAQAMTDFPGHLIHTILALEVFPNEQGA